MLELHPLDFIEVRYEGDPIKRLDEAMAYLVRRAHYRLDRVKLNMTVELNSLGRD